jgi:hypothetical protein
MFVLLTDADKDRLPASPRNDIIMFGKFFPAIIGGSFTGYATRR